VLLSLLTIWGLGFAIKGTRIVISHFTGGGGSAA
jgi:hypothetical protein